MNANHTGNNKFWEEYTDKFRDILFMLLIKPEEKENLFWFTKYESELSPFR